jgi:hypothetical protein
VVSSPDDPFSNPATDVPTLVTGDKRVSLKNLHVVDPGPAPLGMTLVGIDLFNGTREAAWTDIVVRPSQFGGGTVGLLLPAPRFKDRTAALDGFQAVPLAPGDPVGNWYRPEHHEGERPGLLTRWEGLDRTVLWQASPTAVSALRGLRLAARQTLKAVLVLSLKGDRPDLAPRVTLEQWVNGKLVGGSTFQVGYDLPPDAIAAGRARRIRVTWEELAWADDTRDRHRTGVLWSRLMLADDPERAYLRYLGSPAQSRRSEALFDGLVLDGESLTLELLELACMGDPNHGERLYSRRFDGGVSRWLGHHTIREGRDHIRGAYRIEEIVNPAVAELD